jgi:hypothetical protein
LKPSKDVLLLKDALRGIMRIKTKNASLAMNIVSHVLIHPFNAQNAKPNILSSIKVSVVSILVPEDYMEIT